MCCVFHSGAAMSPMHRLPSAPWSFIYQNQRWAGPQALVLLAAPATLCEADSLEWCLQPSATQPSARNEYNDISDSPRTHLGGLWRFKMSPYADLMLLPPATLRFLRLWPVYFFRDSGTGWVSSWYLVVPAYCESHLPRNPSREDGKRWAPPRCDS